MDPNTVQTSFIPKKPLTEERAPAARSVSLLNFLSVFIFLASLLAAGGLFFYRGILQSSISDMEASLARSKASFEPGLISDLQTLDKRLNSANEVLDNHIAVSPIFLSLNALTLKSVRFTKFDYEIASDSSSSITVKMSGETAPGPQGYTSIALESNKLAENKYFKDITFSNLTLTQAGGVSFDLTFTVDRNFLMFEKNIANQ
jgi:hypothetical protein